MKSYFINILKKITYLNTRLKIKSQTYSPADLYFKDVAKHSYEVFKPHFKNSYVFSDDNSIRSFAINEAIKTFDNDNLFLEFGVFKGLYQPFCKKLKKDKWKYFDLTLLKD